MTYNILDDELEWKAKYRSYIKNLDVDSLIKELKYVTHIDKDFKNSISLDFINSYEEVWDMKIRMEIICEVIKEKFSSMEDKIKDVIANPVHYNVGE